MKTIKRLGVCLDHSSAHLIEFSVDSIVSKTIESKFTHEEKIQKLNVNENRMHNQEQHQQSEYYKNIGEVIKNYNDVLLFGPTDAKAELYNILKTDNNYINTKIEVSNTDKMNINQELAYVRKYFSKR